MVISTGRSEWGWMCCYYEMWGDLVTYSAVQRQPVLQQPTRAAVAATVQSVQQLCWLTAAMTLILTTDIVQCFNWLGFAQLLQQLYVDTCHNCSHDFDLSVIRNHSWDANLRYDDRAWWYQWSSHTVIFSTAALQTGLMPHMHSTLHCQINR